MKLGRTTKIRQNFFVPSAHSIILNTSVSSLYGSTRLSYPYPHRSRLSFLFSPIDHLRFNPSSKFLSIRSCALSVLYVFLLFILPPRLLLRLSLDCSGFLWPSIPSRFGFLAASPIAGSIRGLFICLGVTSPWVGDPSKTSHYIVPWSVSASHLHQSSSYRFCNLSSPVILPCQSATVPLRPCLRSCQCLHGIAIVFPLLHHRIPAVIRSPDL